MLSSYNSTKYGEAFIDFSRTFLKRGESLKLIKNLDLVLLSLNVLAIFLWGNMLLLKRSFRPRHECSVKWFFTTLGNQRTSAGSGLIGTTILSTVCRLLLGLTLVSELPKLWKKVFPTFRLLRSDISECFLLEAWLVKAEQLILEILKSFVQKLQYALNFVDLFSHG